MKTKVLFMTFAALLNGCAVSGSAAAPKASKAKATPPPLSCGSLRPGDADFTVVVDGSARVVRMHVPASAKGVNEPLVIVLHGGGMAGGKAIQAPCRMDPVADKNGFLVAYPDGSGKVLWGYTWNGGDCCGKARETKADDVGDVEAVIDSLVQGGCVDRRRVYVTGVSNGGMMAQRIGCDLADKVAAIAPIAGPLMDPTCTPKRPMPVMMLHGTGDKFIPYDGGGNFKGAGATHPFPSAPETVKEWMKINRCGEESRVWYRKGDTTCVAHEQCAGGAAVMLCSVEGGGHTWPGGATYLDWWIGNTTQNISNETMWKFFEEHPMP
jgi:polyhydroxybutyrate depolymerase